MRAHHNVIDMHRAILEGEHSRSWRNSHTASAPLGSLGERHAKTQVWRLYLDIGVMYPNGILMPLECMVRSLVVSGGGQKLSSDAVIGLA